MVSEKAPFLSDIDIARAIACAVCRVPGVAGMSSGRLALQATYGPGEHLSGVVLHHLEAGDLTVGIYVVVAESLLLAAFDQPGDCAAEKKQRPSLLHLAEQIRTVTAQAVSRLGLSSPMAIDVMFDDIG